MEYIGSDIKLVVSEMDGIINGGKSNIDELGNVLYKEINMNDFEAVNEIKKHCSFVFLSSDNSINYNLCRRKNIPFYWERKNKLSVLNKIMVRYEATANQTIYVGSKLSDAKCLQAIPVSVCPNNTNLYIRDKCLIVTKSNSGEGVLMEVLGLVLDGIKNVPSKV